ncbi:MAG: hypothetical protein WC586_11975 [Methanoregula sp.]
MAEVMALPQQKKAIPPWLKDPKRPAETKKRTVKKEEIFGTISLF